ncbi:hypothetical protein [Corynebacterium cystitidis]|uniref:hypothetical protein n=1 Tax=Corynebacterium cystitidis TaxID=35757 RepID=UPI00211DBA85|nr:hypothetical protein [Corynebacterium cystitidis]
MSFDVIIIDPDTVPTSDHEEFLGWYRTTTQWQPAQPYQPSSTIRACYSDLTTSYPDLNGDDFDEDDEDYDDDSAAEYVVGDDFIYVAFSWSDAEDAATTARDVAHKHNLAYVDISNDSAIYLPDGTTITP